VNAEELPVGTIISVGLRRSRYLGGGKFEPLPDDEVLAKRFDPSEAEPFFKAAR
jgi:hypothetical protein